MESVLSFITTNQTCLLLSVTTFTLIYFIRRYYHSASLPDPDLTNKVFIVTGASDGIGKESAKYLLEQGATVIYACRSRVKTEKVINSLNKKLRTNAHFIECDLSDYSSIEKFVDAFNKKFDRLDCLLNNAGLWKLSKELSKNGHEITLQANHLGHFLLTDHLYEKINKSKGRVVNVSSAAYKYTSIPADYFESKEGYWSDERRGFVVYGWTKALNVIFTRYLGLLQTEKRTKVNSYVLHPGMIRTNIIAGNTNLFWYCLLMLTYPIQWLFMKNAREGAYTSIFCCCESPDFMNNASYYVACKEARISKQFLEEEMIVKTVNYSIEMLENVGFKCNYFEKIRASKN